MYAARHRRPPLQIHNNAQLHSHHLHTRIRDRSMDGIERLYWAVVSVGMPLEREHWSLTTGLKLQPGTENLVSVVRQGWIALRDAHPSLASHVENGKKVYKVATEDELNSWLIETFVVVDSTAKGLFPTFKPV
jgi:hypothetical protein